MQGIALQNSPAWVAVENRMAVEIDCKCGESDRKSFAPNAGSRPGVRLPRVSAVALLPHRGPSLNGVDGLWKTPSRSATTLLLDAEKTLVSLARVLGAKSN